MDSNPRVLGGASVSTPRKTPRVCLKSTCAATLIWPKSAALHSDLQFLLGRGVEGIAGALVIGDGVGQHGPGLSHNGSSIHRRGLRLAAVYCPGCKVIGVSPGDTNASRVNAKPKGLPSRSAA